MHGLVVKKAKSKRPLIFEGGLWHQNHAEMNIRILGDAMAVQRRNDQKVATCVHDKVQCEWDELLIVTQ
jgi:hypothetical protein